MSAISKQALLVDNNESFPNNNAGAITPSDLRAFNVNVIDSTVNQTEYTTNSGSWNVSIGELNAFTASQQPSFTALNSFTASQLNINSGVNSFTQSAIGRLNTLEIETANLEAFTSSINQIIVNGASIGTSTRFFFNGFVSASIVPNVGGAIASITVLSDPSLVSTASFNSYTASTAATQSIFSASVATSLSQSSNAFNQFSQSQNSFNLSATASLVELLNLSSSLSGGYATQGELDQSASVLQANIDTKLNTSSFNAYTQSFSQSVATSFSASASSVIAYSSSQATVNSGYNSYTASNDTKWTTIGLLTGSYATTGSNVFTGSQTITGSVYGNIISASIASSTASLDLNTSNFFTLELVSGSTTHLTATNVRPGQTINLLVTQPSVGFGSLSYSTQFAFPQFNIYSPTNQSGSADILTLITFDTNKIYSTAVKNLV
jgi:hypothetical protein